MAKRGVWIVLLLFIVLLLAVFASVAAGKLLNHPVLTFISNAHGNNDIFLFDVHTRQLHNFTKSPAIDEISYVWSQSGERIIYTVSTDSGVDLFVMDANGQGRRQINGLPTAQAYNLTWSPTAQELAYFSSYQNTSDLYLISLVDNINTNLTNTPDIGETYPEWSPDGINLLFYMQNDLHLMNMESGTIRRMTDTPNREEFAGWSPDGSTIVFQRPEEFTGRRQLFMLTVLDGKEKLLTNVLAPRPQPISWSPDSQSFVVGLDSQQLVIFDIETATTHTLSISSTGAVWSPDGRYIAYMVNQEIQIYDLETAQTLPLDLSFPLQFQSALVWIH